MKPRCHESFQSPMIHKSCWQAAAGKIISTTGETSSELLNENAKLLLELQVTESLCETMSKTARISGVNADTNETTGHVEVTIVRPRSATVSVESNASRAGSRSIKILSRIEEQEGNRADIRTASPASVYGNQRRESSNPNNSCLFEYKERNELKFERLNHHPVYPNDQSACRQGFESLCDNTCNQRRGPFVELEALHKLLDRLRPDDLESTSAWYSSESCCREIVLRFQNLLSEWASDQKRVDDCLATDDTLSKCEHCGVIKCVEVTRHRESILERKDNQRIAIAEREVEVKSKNHASPLVKSIGRTEIMRNSYPVVPPRRSDITHREKLSLETICSNPVAKKVSTKGGKNKKTVNQSCATRNKRIVMSDDSYELQGREASKNLDNTFVYDEKYLEGKYRKSGQEESHPLMETVKYLARGNLATVEDKSQKDSLRDNSTNDIGPSFFRKPCNQKKNSFALHGSRDVDFQEDPHFFLCDRVRFREDELHTELHIKPDEIKSKPGTLDLSNAASFSDHNGIQLKESGTSTFSSSSAENMIRRWIKPSRNILEANLERVKDSGNEALAVGPSLPSLQSIKARIIDAIQKFANRSDDSSYGQPDDSTEKNRSDNGSMIKPRKNPDYPKKNSTDRCSGSALSVMSSRNFERQRLSVETSERFERQILYDQVSSRETISEDSITAAGSKVLLMYRKILESNEEMDWESFEQLVSALHPSQRELWCDICKAVSNEAKRVADETGATTEVCIEINPLPCKLAKPTIRAHGDEITFELDMIVNDVQALLKKDDRSVSSKKANKDKKEAIESNQM